MQCFCCILKTGCSKRIIFFLKRTRQASAIRPGPGKPGRGPGRVPSSINYDPFIEFHSVFMGQQCAVSPVLCLSFCRLGYSIVMMRANLNKM